MPHSAPPILNGQDQLPCVLLLKCDCHILPFNCPHLERGAGLQFWDNLYSHCKNTRFITETLLLFCLIYIGLITVKGTLHLVVIGVQVFWKAKLTINYHHHQYHNRHQERFSGFVTQSTELFVAFSIIQFSANVQWIRRVWQRKSI